MSEQVDQKQRVLKIIVIGLGILIVICLGVIVAGMAMQAAKLDKKKAAEEQIDEPRAASPGKALGELDIPIPHGAGVVAVTGGGRELQVLMETPEGRAVMLVDRKTGKVMGTLRFVPAPAPAAP